MASRWRFAVKSSSGDFGTNGSGGNAHGGRGSVVWGTAGSQDSVRASSKGPRRAGRPPASPDSTSSAFHPTLSPRKVVHAVSMRRDRRNSRSRGRLSDGWEYEVFSNVPSQATTVQPSRFVMTEKNPFRVVWSCILCVMLLYVATCLPFRICFLDFRIPEDDAFEVGLFWEVASAIVDTFFVSDLCVNFFFSFRDARGKEIRNLRRVARNYLKGGFLIDFISCMPSQAIQVILEGFVEEENGDVNSDVNKSMKIGKLNRIPRLSKLFRILRLAKVFQFVRDNAIWQRMQKLRGVTVFNFTLSFFLVVHLASCGWYLCAALHFEPADTLERAAATDGLYVMSWVWRRALEAPMIDESPVVHWLTSMYFVLTVFTTVGFGDISGFTFAEMAYASVLMVVGSLVHGTIMGSVINVLTRADQVAAQRHEQSKLLEDFADHTAMRTDVRMEMLRFIRTSRDIHRNYNTEHVKMLMMTGVFPRDLERRIPGALYKGRLLMNKFLQTCLSAGAMPPQLPLFIALALHQRSMSPGDIVYYFGDQASSIHLVTRGFFSSIVARRSEHSLSKTSLQAESDSSQAVLTHKFRENFCKVGENYPYQLYGKDSYFGDLEVFQDLFARRASTRCEREGTLLILEKHDLAGLAAEFPYHLKALKRYARVREVAWARKLRTSPPYLSYLDLAAFTIQNIWRKSLRDNARRKGSLYNGEESPGQQIYNMDPQQAALRGDPEGAAGSAFARRHPEKEVLYRYRHAVRSPGAAGGGPARHDETPHGGPGLLDGDISAHHRQLPREVRIGRQLPRPR